MDLLLEEQSLIENLINHLSELRNLAGISGVVNTSLISEQLEFAHREKVNIRRRMELLESIVERMTGVSSYVDSQLDEVKDKLTKTNAFDYFG